MIRKFVFLYISICLCIVSLQAQPTPCQKIVDSLTWVIKAKDYRLNRVKFYSKLVDKKPSQAKFLNGWIKRAIK